MPLMRFAREKMRIEVTRSIQSLDIYPKVKKNFLNGFGDAGPRKLKELPTLMSLDYWTLAAKASAQWPLGKYHLSLVFGKYPSFRFLALCQP
jgi:hypothetical protein